MSEETKTESKPSRLTDADKIRVIEWLLKQPKPIEAESWVVAAKAISAALEVRLAPAVLQNLTEASASLRAQVMVGVQGGELSQLRAQVEALSERVDAVVKAYGDAIESLKRDLSMVNLGAPRLMETASGAYAADALPGLEDSDGPSTDTSPGDGTGVPD